MISPLSWASVWHSAIFMHLWQSTLFVAAIWLLTLMLRHKAAQARYRLWMIASAKFLIPFSLLIAAGQSLRFDLGPATGKAAISSAVVSMEQPLFEAMQFTATAHSAVRTTAAAPASTPVHHPVPVLWLLVGVWAAGAILIALRWTRSWWRIHVALRSSLPLDLNFPVPVRTVSSRIEPGVFGIACPVLLLPDGLDEHLSPAQMNAILAHELCHIRRRDNLSAVLHMVVEVLFWFHPAVWWIQGRLLEERERACDEAVLASHGEALSYAEGILNVCKFYAEAPLNCMSGITGSDLKKRIVRVMSQHRGRPLGAGMKALLAVAALIAVGLPLSFGIARPVHAQAQAAEKPDHNIAGTWQGTVHLNNHDLRGVLKVQKAATGKLTATFYSIDQGGRGMPVDSVSFDNGELKYAIQFIGLTYTGKLSAGGNSISGTITQMGHSYPLVFERATPETAWTIPPPPPHIAPMAANADPGIEVATIKPTKPGERGKFITMRGTDLITRGFTLGDLIKSAYNLQDKQILNGPSWMDSDKFDIDVKPDVPGMPDSEQLNDLIKKLLADRFQLKMHMEQKDMSAYVLMVAKGGPKMTKNDSHGGLPGLFFGPPIITLRVRNATMDGFTHLMQSAVMDRPVVNQTGLTGKWNFVLHWTPDATQFIHSGWKMPPPSNAADAPPPLLIAIREQLGLKLGTEKTSVPVLVIDHVDHPSAN